MNYLYVGNVDEWDTARELLLRDLKIQSVWTNPPDSSMEYIQAQTELVAFIITDPHKMRNAAGLKRLLNIGRHLQNICMVLYVQDLKSVSAEYRKLCKIIEL